MNEPAFALQHDWRQQYGRPQVFASLLLLAFLGQCLWLMAHTPLSPMEQSYIQQGQAQLSAGTVAEDAVRSPLTALTASLEVPRDRFQRFAEVRWLARLPFLIAGLLLGASIWYVARRLYGNVGGYIALALYAFAPSMVQRSAAAQPMILATWGTFGAIFTAIAVSHTLYAPREVVLWNWKRIALLGVALALAVGAQVGLLLILPLAFAIMLYVVPERRRAALAIFAAACAVAWLLFWAFYNFHLHAMLRGLAHLGGREFMPSLLGHKLTYELLGVFFLRLPAPTLLLIAALITYAVWKRPRYFGTTAPLIAFAYLILLGIVLPQQGGYTMFVAALPFAFVFIAGVFADLLATSAAGIVFGMLTGILIAHALFSLMGLARVR
ncbi:MAG TPA: hypothetical protein VFU76_13600 [Terriglobales bacterium]|nr:hypothetical protein [Terriglobales bacterium]